VLSKSVNRPCGGAARRILVAPWGRPVVSGEFVVVDSVSDAERMIDEWGRNAGQKAARFQRMAVQVEQVSITESVAGGAVRVTVGHNGIPTDVSMTEQVLRMRPEEIASSVMAAVRKAQSRYPERLAGILADTVGEEDPASRYLMATAEENFPPVDESEESEEPDGERLTFDEDHGDEGDADGGAGGQRPRQAPENGDDGDGVDGDWVFRR
jgi:DNA-binding protein YbaB